MAAPDIALVKLWSRIDGTEFDNLLPTMIASATALASHECGVDYTVEAMPEAVQQWVCAVVGWWLSNPDMPAASRNETPAFLARLLDPCRSFNWTPPA